MVKFGTSTPHILRHSREQPELTCDHRTARIPRRRHPRDATPDHHNMTIAHQLGIDAIDSIFASRLYYLRGNITRDQAQTID